MPACKRNHCLVDHYFFLQIFLTSNYWKTYLQHTICIFSRNILCVDAFIQRKAAFEATAAVFP